MREKPIYVSIAPMLAVCTNPELSVGKHNQDCDNFTELEFFWKEGNRMAPICYTGAFS